jgi:hypothetical protein
LEIWGKHDGKCGEGRWPNQAFVRSRGCQCSSGSPANGQIMDIRKSPCRLISYRERQRRDVNTAQGNALGTRPKMKQRAESPTQSLMSRWPLVDHSAFGIRLDRRYRVCPVGAPSVQPSTSVLGIWAKKVNQSRRAAGACAGASAPAHRPYTRTDQSHRPTGRR